MKYIIPAKSQLAGERLIKVLGKMAAKYEYDAGSVFSVSPKEISEFIHCVSSVQRIIAVAKAHPELVEYTPGYRKTDQGCLASRAAAGYYSSQIKWIVQ